MKNDIKTFQNILKNPIEKKPVLTLKVGAITKWVRDVLAIILMWKLIAVIY